MTLDRDALLAKLQALTAPSREVDGDIARHLGWVEKRLGGAGIVWYAPGSDGHPTPVPPRYTGSVEAALPLLDGWWWLFAKGRKRKKAPLHSIALYPEGEDLTEESSLGYTIGHDLLAVAIIIAALKARKTLS